MRNRLDFVAMKHRSAEKIQKKIMGLSLEEELEFWQKCSVVLRNRKEKLKESKIHEVKV